MRYAVYLALLWALNNQVSFGFEFPPEDETSKGVAFFLASIPELGIHVIREEEERLLYYLQGTYVSPRISPDRSQIILHSRRGGGIGIWLGDMESKELRRLCDGDQANWSSDGRSIVFRREGRIFERNLTTGEETRVSPQEFSECRFPSYLPDGSGFLFVNQKAIYTIQGSSTDARLVARGEIRSAPRVSPDGLTVAWQDGAHLSLFTLNTGENTRLTIQGGIQSWPLWSQDGEHLAYCHSPLPEGPWDLYVTTLKDPQSNWLIRSNIHPGFDWNGLYAPVSAPTTIVASHLTVRFSEGASQASSNGRMEQPRGNSGGSRWRDAENRQEYLPPGADVLIENRWLTVIGSSNGNPIRLFLKEGTAGSYSLELVPSPPDQVRGRKPVIQLEYYREDEVRLKILYSEAESAPVGITLCIPRDRPLIELHASGLQGISLRMETKLALIPDRLANDLVLDPKAYSSPRVTLPYTPLLLAPLQSGSGMLMIVTPGCEQKMELRSGPSSFEQIDISTGAEKIFLALLDGDQCWQEAEVEPTGTKEIWQAKWTHPFLARWRIAAVNDTHVDSQMWGEESLNLNSSLFLPIDSSFAARPDPTVIYLFGRSWHTPLDVITPLDLLVDAVGIEQSDHLLDEEGIRSYRTADGPVSFREITTREEEWSRELVHVDSRDPNWVELGVLESMQGLRAADTPGVRSLITHFGQDMVSILKGLDNRIGEYEQFLGHLRAFCHSRESRAEGTFDILATIDEQARVLQGQVEQMSVQPVSATTTAIEEMLGALGAGTYLHGTREYGKLSKVVRASQNDRLDVIRLYREFFKTIRSIAGKTVTTDSNFKKVGDQLREMTQNILRNRYYLERDWSGETPLREDTE